MKIAYNLENGKIKDLPSSSFDESTNKLVVKQLSSSAVYLNLNDGIIFSNNKLLSSSVGSNNQVLAWNTFTDRWDFTDTGKLPADSTLIPSNSDVTGSYLTNSQVKCLSNATTGTLPVSRGGTGLSIADFNYYGEALLFGNDTNKLILKPSSEDSTKPVVLAQFTASSTIDDSYNQNIINLVKGQISDAPAAIFGSTKALSSSYDANAANYTSDMTFLDEHSGDFTAECWAYLVNIGNTIYSDSRSVVFLTNNNFAILTTGPSQNGTTGNYGIWNSTGNFTTNLSFLANQWVHLALIRNGNRLQLFANATGSYQIDITNSSIPNLNKMYIGSNGNGNWNVNGYITDFCFTKYAKTSSEITLYYNAVKLQTKQRHNKEETDLLATDRIQSVLKINDTGQKNIIIEGYFGPISTNVLNDYIY